MLSKLEKVEALYKGATTPGERAAAKAALCRVWTKEPAARMFDGCSSSQDLFNRLALVWEENAQEPRPEWDQKLHRLEASLVRLDPTLVRGCMALMQARRFAVYADPALSGKDLKRLGVLLWSFEQATRACA